MTTAGRASPQPGIRARKQWQALADALAGVRHRTPCRAAPAPWWSDDAAERAEAAAACTHCPVRRECRAYATQAHERWGVWGGRDYEDVASARGAVA